MTKYRQKAIESVVLYIYIYIYIYTFEEKKFGIDFQSLITKLVDMIKQPKNKTLWKGDYSIYVRTYV